MSTNFRDRLMSLPQRSDETWQGGLLRMPVWITGEDWEPYRAYCPFWVAVRADMIHLGKIQRPHERSLASAADELLNFARDRRLGGYRPGRVEVKDAELAEHLRPLLEGTGIDLVVVPRLAAVERVLDSMQSHGNPKTLTVPNPLDAPGVTEERLRQFAEAAAEFYRAAPWRHFSDLDLIEVESPAAPHGMACTTVLGAGRTLYGLGFYADRDDFAQFLQNPRQASTRTLRWQLTFNPPREFPFKDADLWDDRQLPVASESAYPLLVQLSLRQVQRADADHLAFVTLLLRALAATSEAEIDTGRWSKQVPTQEGSITMTLALPDLLDPLAEKGWMDRGLMPDRRANERVLAEIGRYFQAHPPADEAEMQRVLQTRFSGPVQATALPATTPAEQAEELCYRACETHGRRRVQLARQALTVHPDCAEAYVILAEQAGTLADEADYYAQAMAAAERTLGSKVFQEECGHFWGIVATRPYMRARQGLAQALAELDRLEEAVGHYQELLRLNPNDNQGIRYLLMPQLLMLRQDAEAARLLKAYDENTANWAYARALLAFRLSGKSTTARKELRAAMRANPHVPQFLLEEEALPHVDRYTLGSPEEAICCVEELGPAFRATRGAAEWLAGEHRQYEKERRTRLREKVSREKDRRKRKG